MQTPRRSRSAIIAAGFRAIAAEQDEQHKLLKEIKGLLVKNIDEFNENRSHVSDEFDRMGRRVLRTENRIGALELVAGNDGE